MNRTDVVRVRTPVRVDFAGGWTDVPTYAAAHGGIVTNAAVALYVHTELIPGGGAIRLRAEDIGERVTVHHPSQLVYDGRLDLHKAALNMLPVTGGVELLTRAEVPAGSGLGGSGSLDVGLVAALAAARRESYTPAELAELGFQLEAGELGLEGGRQDQYAAALGGWHELSFDADGVCDILPIAASPEQARDLAAHVVLVYTGQSHFSSGTHRRVWDAYAGGQSEVAAALNAIRDLGREAASALRAADWAGLARVVDENWRHQQRLDPTISTPGSRAVEESLRAAGAWGLKATGAGAGGCLFAICPPDRVVAVTAAAQGMGAQVLPFAFDFTGAHVTVEASDEGP